MRAIAKPHWRVFSDSTFAMTGQFLQRHNLGSFLESSSHQNVASAHQGAGGDPGFLHGASSGQQQGYSGSVCPASFLVHYVALFPTGSPFGCHLVGFNHLDLSDSPLLFMVFCLCALFWLFIQSGQMFTKITTEQTDHRTYEHLGRPHSRVHPGG